MQFFTMVEETCWGFIVYETVTIKIKNSIFLSKLTAVLDIAFPEKTFKTKNGKISCSYWFHDYPIDFREWLTFYNDLYKRSPSEI